MTIYADDILVAATHCKAKIANRDLNNFLTTLADYFDNWRMRLNTPKCSAIIFKGKIGKLYKNARQYIPRVTIGRETIANVDRLKYLGVVFQENMSFVAHLDHILVKCKGAFAAYSGVMRSRKGLATKLKLAIYRAIIRPRLSYAFSIWSAITSHQMERLRVAERKMLRYCLNLKWKLTEWGFYSCPANKLVYELSKLERIDVFMTRVAIGLLDRAADSENELIRRCAIEREDLDRIIHTEGFLTPMCLNKFPNENIVKDGKLVLYHRRFNSYNFDDLVYDTSQ